MVLFNDQDQTDEPPLEEGAADPEEEDTDFDDHPSCVTSQTRSQLFVEVRGHSHGRPVRIDLAVNHSISALTRGVDSARRNSSSAAIPTRSVSSLRSLFDLAGPSSTYGHGRELGGRSSVLALQVPASSLPPPLTASVIVDSFQISASNAFFSPLLCNNEASPSTSESLPCMPCQAPPSSLHAASISPTRNRNSLSQTPHSCAVGQGEVVRRLTEVLQGSGDESLVLPLAGRDGGMSQWLQALDVHVVGACRADERLQPMLRWNSSCTGADGQLLAHLSQHFKVDELGMLARCLCAPLVSIRVGKVQLQGHFVCPTASRGYLSLSLLPCSEMRLSFIADDGEIERIAAVKSIVEDTHVTLEMLDADLSGRSFLLKTSSGKHFFWQSERSMAVGRELVTKMKDYLLQRPTLSQLTGVSESRLNSFVCQLRNNLAAASASAGFQPSSPLHLSSASSSTPATSTASSSSSTSCGVRQSPRLSPRASGFKDGATKGLTNLRSFLSSREKHRRRCDKLNPASALSLSSNHCGSSNLDSNPDQICASLPFVSCSAAVSASEDERVVSQSCLSTSSPFVPGLATNVDPYLKQAFSVPLISACPLNSISPMLGGSCFSSNGLHLPIPSHLPIPTSTFLAPYYCPCPLRSSALQYTFTPPYLPPNSEMNNASSSTFYSVKPSSTLLSQTTISLDRGSISPIPLPVASLVNIPMPLQPTSLSSFFSDPIVHIPVVDFQSASKGFLVNAPSPVPSSGFPNVLPSFLSNILSGGERSLKGQDTLGQSVFQGLGLPGLLEREHLEHDVLPFLPKNRVLARCSDDGAEQVSESLWSTSLSSDVEGFPEFSNPLLGMVPALLTSGNLSCVVNFHQERNMGTSAWVSGSRGLYGGTCEPGIPPAIFTSSASVGLRVRGIDVLQTHTHRTDNLVEEESSKGRDDEDEASKDG
ncbi:hypothetical protein L7F22_045807 [Adiantum nelumboides]|nr:hypothetical protein [Adiantum nelumboides]